MQVQWLFRKAQTWKIVVKKLFSRLLARESENFHIKSVRFYSIELNKNPVVHHEVVNSPKHRTMILEMALVELVPTKAFMRSVMDVFGLLIPGAQVLGLTGSGSVAIEGRIRDADTGEVIFKFADRQQDKTAIISAQDFTWHGHAKEIIDDWAKEFVELYDTPSSHMVAMSSHFTLKPW